MPQVTVKHQAITDPSATVAPAREAIPPGIYHALIPAVVNGMRATNETMITVEYQLLFTDDTHDAALAGRRVFQQYVLEPVADPTMAALHRHELRQLLDATGVAYTDAGFNTDHMLRKTVKITVKQKPGKVADADGHLPVFSNVVRVDTAEAISDTDIV